MLLLNELEASLKGQHALSRFLPSKARQQRSMRTWKKIRKQHLLPQMPKNDGILGACLRHLSAPFNHPETMQQLSQCPAF